MLDLNPSTVQQAIGSSQALPRQRQALPKGQPYREADNHGAEADSHGAEADSHGAEAHSRLKTQPKPAVDIGLERSR